MNRRNNLLTIFILVFISKKIQNNKTGEPNRLERKLGKNLSLIIPISKKEAIHVHHWMLASYLLKKFRKKKIINKMCIVAIIDGLLYKDRLEIIKVKNNCFLSDYKKW